MRPLRLDTLTLLNYKNIAEAHLQLCKSVNCFVGLNGQGKTNVLDAIYYLSFCKSHHVNIDSQNIKHDQEFFMLQGEYTLGEQHEEIDCAIRRRQKKHFRRNKRNYERLTDHIGLLPLVLVSPADSALIGDGSDERRRFMDSIIAQYDRQYLLHLLQYNNALKQRNALLKADEHPDTSMLEIFETVMVEHAAYIYDRRNAFTAQFVPRFQHFYDLIADHKEHVGLAYESQLHERQLDEALRRTRERDIMLGWTSQGIHKDDINMTLGEWPVKRIASQGQQKTYIIAMKLAQYDLLGSVLDVKPLLLLDDLFDKLDAERMKRILLLVSSDEFGQIFITDTDRSHLQETLGMMGSEHRIFNVSNGIITPEHLTLTQ